MIIFVETEFNFYWHSLNLASGMTTYILGVGLGLFAILTVWISAILIFLVSLRLEKRIGTVALAIASIITIILVSIPRSPQYPVAEDNKVSYF